MTWHYDHTDAARSGFWRPTVCVRCAGPLRDDDLAHARELAWRCTKCYWGSPNVNIPGGPQ